MSYTVLCMYNNLKKNENLVFLKLQWIKILAILLYKYIFILMYKV